MPTPQRRPAVRTLVLLVLAAVVLAAVAVLVLTRTPDEQAAASSSPASTTATPYASFTVGPEPTEVATDAPAPGVDPVSTTSDPSSAAALEVVLTYAQYQSDTGTVQANGFVSGVIEDGGTCTLTLQRDGTEVVVETVASADATTTSCGLLETGTDVAPGTWDAQLTYSSATGSGSSAVGEVVVP